MYDARDYWSVAWRLLSATIIACLLVFVAFTQGHKAGFQVGGQVGYIQGTQQCAAQGSSLESTTVRHRDSTSQGL
jgi:hypothetical protein